jgi:hypothetical protein
VRPCPTGVVLCNETAAKSSEQRKRVPAQPGCDEAGSRRQCRCSTLEPTKPRQPKSEVQTGNIDEVEPLDAPRTCPSVTPTPTARAAGRLLTSGRVVVSNEHIAPMPSTTAPDNCTSRHGAHAAWLATTSLPRRSTTTYLDATTRPRRTSPLARAARHHSPARHSARRPTAPRVSVRPRITARAPRVGARRRPFRHRAPPPSCPRAGFASAWGHPRAQAEGRARGPDHAALSRGQPHPLPPHQAAPDD